MPMTRPVAVITGGADGIGRATADLFAARGHQVVIADLTGADATAADLGQDHHGETLDVTDEVAVRAFVAGLSRVDVLVNNAGIGDSQTRYISLATVAFYGTGAYTVAVLTEVVPCPVALLSAGLIGAGMALVIGLSTLRLAGVYFVIFTFGLAELIRQVITWYEVNVTGTLGRYIFLEITARQIYWQMLALAAVTIGLTAWINRARLGLALRVIGDDEVVAAHSGIPLARTKLLAFVLSAVILTLAGAIASPRWVYIEPAIVFNPTYSFLTVIMALFGGANRLWGPRLGAVPLFLTFEWLSSHFPDTYPIFLGLLFIGVVFLLPDGVLRGIETLRARKRGLTS